MLRRHRKARIRRALNMVERHYMRLWCLCGVWFSQSRTRKANGFSVNEQTAVHLKLVPIPMWSESWCRFSRGLFLPLSRALDPFAQYVLTEPTYSSVGDKLHDGRAAEAELRVGMSLLRRQDCVSIHCNL